MKGESGIKAKELPAAKSSDEEMSPLTEEDDRDNFGEIIDGLGDVLKEVVDTNTNTNNNNNDNNEKTEPEEK